MTQKEILESVLAEIKHVKTHMPNGELKQMANAFQKMKEDVSDLKRTLLNPDNGVIVNTNKNTEFRLEKEGREKEYNTYIFLSKHDLIIFASTSIILTVTELPACLYKCELATSVGNLKDLGNH